MRKFGRAGIRNIFSRVTGGNPSQLFGTLGVLDVANLVLGEANLFFINPNGIIFGSNARLDMRGSFVASTASSLLFSNGSRFNARNPEALPLLTVNVPVPIGLQFEEKPGDIRVQGSDLEVAPEKTLALIGGNVSLDGGVLQARGGRVELGGAAGTGRVDLNVVGNNLNLSFPNDLALEDITLTNGALVKVSANTSGSIAINARKFSASGESIVGAGTIDGKGSDISINAKSVSLNTGSTISSFTFGTGQGGNVTLNTDSVSLNTGSTIGSFTSGTGQGGNVTIVARNLMIQTGGQIATEAEGVGAGGNLSIKASESVELKDAFSYLFANTRSDGNSGILTIETPKLVVRDGARIGTSTLGNGSAGDVTIIAPNLVKIIGYSPDIPFNSSLMTSGLGNGNAGNVRIETGNLIVKDGGLISTSVVGSGQGGNIIVKASGTVEVSGTDPINLSFLSKIVPDAFANNSNSTLLRAILNANIFPSGLTTQTSGGKNSGNVTIETGRLIVRDGGFISTITVGAGEGGNLTVYARDSVELRDRRCQ